MQAVAHFVETFVPEHYEVFLDLNRKTKTFSGRVVITGQAKADKISLHQKDHRNSRSSRSSPSIYG